MKKDIHPKYSHDVKVTCSCGNTFVTGSTAGEIVTELCSSCHPFYTGEQKTVDTDNLISKFEKRKEKAKKSSFRSKKQKIEARRKRMAAKEEEKGAPLTLKDMLSSISTK